jgi:hypothetical protein
MKALGYQPWINAVLRAVWVIDYGAAAGLSAGGSATGAGRYRISA